MAELTPEKRSLYVRTLLETVSAFAEEAPAFEENNVEEFLCEDVEHGSSGFVTDPEARCFMRVRIDGEAFVVTASRIIPQ